MHSLHIINHSALSLYLYPIGQVISLTPDRHLRAKKAPIFSANSWLWGLDHVKTHKKQNIIWSQHGRFWTLSAVQGEGVFLCIFFWPWKHQTVADVSCPYCEKSLRWYPTVTCPMKMDSGGVAHLFLKRCESTCVKSLLIVAGVTIVPSPLMD